MALTKAIITDLTEIVGEYKAVQCREATVISEDGVEISRSFHRHVLHPSSCEKNLDSDGEPDGSFTHTDTDISAEPAETQSVCAAVWTDAVKAAWKTKCESDFP
jgi:hypothetical protein